MPDHSSSAGDADSSSGLWPAIKKFFDAESGERSLRAQLEEQLDEAEHDDAESSGEPAKGDLSLVERQMLRNLLHFSEHDADDIAVPRGEITAVPSTATWDEIVEAFAERVGARGVLVEQVQAQLVGPPVPVAGAATGGRVERALHFVGHRVTSPLGWVDRNA